MDKKQLIKIANETLNILETGMYKFDRNKSVNFLHDLKKSIENTILYKPDFVIEQIKRDNNSIIEVTNESTLHAGIRLKDEGFDNVVCLNFASAKYPGGGFLKGSRAQEESLVRSSGLYASINQKSMREMYNYNQDLDGLYSDYMIYSPSVPVFRDDDYKLLNRYHNISFITSPAVNLNATNANYKTIKSVMLNRMDRILGISNLNNADALVLGAFGCGVFKNDPEMIAENFEMLINSKYKNCFKKIIFAIKTKDQDLINTFENILL